MLKIKVFNYQTGEFQETTLTPETMVQGECLIGRAFNCKLVLDSSEVSRVHGRIKSQKNEYYYTDLGSANNSHNNQEVQSNQSYGLKVNDLIRIGDFVLLVESIENTRSPGELFIWEKLGGDRYWTKGDLIVRCTRICDETPDVKTFTFVADPPVLFSYQPGQFVTLELEINGQQVLRSYSISSTSSRPHTLNPPSSSPPPFFPAIAQPSSNGLVDSPLPRLALPPVVVFAQSGKEVTGDGSRSNCRQGVCRDWRKRKQSGEVSYESEPDGLEQSEQKVGYILTCVAAPVGRVVIEA